MERKRGGGGDRFEDIMFPSLFSESLDTWETQVLKEKREKARELGCRVPGSET